MEKVILYEWPGKATNLRQTLEQAKQRYNGVFDQFNALKLGVTIENKYFVNQLIENAENVVYLIYRDRIPRTDPVTGLEVDRDAKMKGLKLPSLNKLKDALSHLENKQSIDERMNFLDLVSGQLVINEAYFENYCDQTFRTVTYNPAVVEAYKAFKALEKVLNDLQSKVRFIESDRLTNEPVLKPFDVVSLSTGEVKFSDIRFKENFMNKIK